MKNIILADCAKNEITSFADGLSKETNKNWEIVSSVSNWGQASKIQNLKRYAIYFAAPFKAFCKRKQYASIVGWQQFYALIFCFYCRLFKVKKTNRVVALNFTYKSKKGFIGKIYKRFMQYMVNSDYIDYIHVLSHNYAKKCVEELGIDEKKILVFPFGTNDQYESFKKIKKTENEFVLAIGRSNRDYEWLIDEWRSVDYPLYIICDTFKAPNNLPNNIKIFNNITGNAQYKYIASCKYLVLPIKDESICSGDTVLLTAMSNKKTVIVNGPSTLTEMYVKDGENAIIVSKKKGELAEKMNYLLKNNIEIGESARKSYLENYSRGAMGRNIGKALSKQEQEKKMKVLIVNPIMYTNETCCIKKVNSIKDTMIYDLCLAFLEKGIDITLATGDLYKPTQEESYPFEIKWMKIKLTKLFPPHTLPYCPEIKKIAKNGNYDLIITSEVFSLNSLLLSLHSKKNLIVWHELAKHNKIFRGYASRFWYGVVAKLFFKNTLIVARSLEAKEFISQYCNNVCNDIIDHGVNLEKFLPSSEKEDIFAISSQLIERKHIEKTIDAFSKYIEKYNANENLVIMGDGDKRSELEQQVERLGIQQRVKFTGNLAHDELIGILSKAKAMLIYTEKDNNMISITESIAVATPIITTCVPYNARDIKAHKLGIAKDCWDENDIKKFVENNEEYVNACLQFRSNISTLNKVESFCEVYEKNIK